jgi:uncharacterized ferredoxin-like protein
VEHRNVEILELAEKIGEEALQKQADAIRKEVCMILISIFVNSEFLRK